MEGGHGGSGAGTPSSIFKRRDRQSKLEFQGVFGMKIAAAVAAHNLELTIDGFDDIGGGERAPHALGVLQERQVVFAFFTQFADESRVGFLKPVAELFKL